MTETEIGVRAAKEAIYDVFYDKRLSREDAARNLYHLAETALGLAFTVEDELYAEAE